MNILQALPRLDTGGVQTYTVDLTKYLIREGHKCFVASAGGELLPELERLGAVHYKLPLDSKVFWVMLKAAGKLADIIRREDIEVIHAHSRVPAWVAFMASRRSGAAFITTAHGYYSRHIFSYMMGAGKFTIVPSSVIGKHMMEKFGVPFENIRLIPSSIDLEKYEFRQPPDKSRTDFIIGVVGRLAPIKGQLFFLKAMAKVARSMPFVKAWIVGGVSPGKDNYLEELQVWARRLGLSHCVQFLGNRRDIPQVLSKLDLLVMPSVTQEAFGRVIVEAQACGVPVIASKVGGVVEIIDDDSSGLLVSAKDYDELAAAILKVLKNSNLACRFAQEGRKKVEEKFSLEKTAGKVLDVYRQALEEPRILVIKISAIGDAILIIPSLQALKKKFPSSKITCLVGRSVKDIFTRCPFVDELIVCDFKDKDKGWRPFLKLVKKLIFKRFDYVIDFQNNKKSHILSFATLCPRRYGYNNGKFSFLLNHSIKDVPGEAIGPIEHQFRVLKMLGISRGKERLGLWPSQEDWQFAKDFLQEYWLGKEKLIGINIGASPRWQSKRWSDKRFAKLCDELAKRDYRVLITGSIADVPYVKVILSQTRTKPICAVAQTTLMQLASLIKKCSVFVTSDSAPMHLAAAINVPFVALFGPTDPKRHLPAADQCVALRKECPPCYKPRCRRARNICIEDITVEEVVQAIESLLEVATKP